MKEGCGEEAFVKSFLCFAGNLPNMAGFFANHRVILDRFIENNHEKAEEGIR